MKQIEEIVVIYDKANQGKTSTLRELINSLTGSLPTLKGDLRVIIQGYYAKGQHKKVNIFIATCGDNLDVIEDNIRFFKGKMPENKPYPTFIFDYRNKIWIDISKEITIPSIEANICISACRSNGCGLDAIDFFMNCNFKNTFACVWIKLSLLRKKLNVGFTKKIAPDWGKVANELKELIDNKFARRIIK